MNEAQENSLRVLLQRLREDDPNRYMSLLFEVIATRFDDESISAMRNVDAGCEDATIVFAVARGVNASKVMQMNLDVLKSQLDEFKEGDGEPE